jgi:murein DD-endopeptidase MepM/ murein hydrolase activator NlpD
VSRHPRLFVAGTTLAVIVLLACCGISGSYFFGDGPLSASPIRPTPATATATACGRPVVIQPGAPLPSVSSLSATQVHNAAIIIKVGQNRHIPPRGWVIAIATALQESDLHNLPNLGARNDHDSIGLFQQRPSQGWGTPIQLLDPEYAAGKFYQKLVTVKDWELLPLTVAAQAVQRSAFPSAYAKHEPLATLIVNQLADGAARAAGAVQQLQCATGGQVTASGWTVPVVAPIVSGWRTADRPTHNGVDLAAPKGTPVHAVAAGVVMVVSCEAFNADGTNYGCDRDGSLTVTGCGWWLEIQHPGSVITRYCHLNAKPTVTVGQQVTGGQIIGYVGATGNASGPHCHFEVHLNGDDSFAGAVDPVPFMASQGAPLGAKS